MHHPSLLTRPSKGRKPGYMYVNMVIVYQGILSAR